MRRETRLYETKHMKFDREDDTYLGDSYAVRFNTLREVPVGIVGSRYKPCFDVTIRSRSLEGVKWDIERLEDELQRLKSFLKDNE